MLRIKKTTALLDAPNGRQIDILAPSDSITATGQVSGEFTEVDTSFNKRGWVRTADCESLDSVPRSPVDVGDFVAYCISVEAAFNDQGSTAPWFVSADFLIARAIIETDIKNAGPKVAGSDAVGPLQVSSQEWARFLSSGSPLVGGFTPPDFDHPLKQVYGAAYRMSDDAKQISALKTPAGAKDTFVPSYLDLFHAYLTGSAKAAVAILDAANSDADNNKPIRDCLQAAMNADEIKVFCQVRSQFTGTDAQPKTVAAFVQATEAALNAALGRAFDLIKQYVPEVLATVKQGEAPWFDVAQAEETDGVAEPNPHILGYFKATDYRPLPTSTDTPWCGAFAAFCMAQSGSAAAAASIPKGAARAANWKTWGRQLPLQSNDVPQGAVIVLTPGAGTGGSGHVGFFVGYSADRKTVELLGGNQSNKVKKSTYPVSRIASINWLDLQPAVTAEQAGAQPSNSPISQAAFDLIVEFEVTSKAVYEKKYRGPEWPGESSGVTIGIGYDVGQTAENVFRGDWRGVISDPMLNALAQTCGITGPAAKQEVNRLKGSVDISWDQAIQVHTDHVIPRWVGLVQSTLPNTGALNEDCLGALVSLTYNRGAGGYTSPKPRYSEMRAIKACMTARRFAEIPDLIRSMKRLWPHSRGLQDRRDREAQFFEDGLAGMPGGQQ